MPLDNAPELLPQVVAQLRVVHVVSKSAAGINTCGARGGACVGAGTSGIGGGGKTSSSAGGCGHSTFKGVVPHPHKARAKTAGARTRINDMGNLLPKGAKDDLGFAALRDQVGGQLVADRHCAAPLIEQFLLRDQRVFGGSLCLVLAAEPIAVTEQRQRSDQQRQQQIRGAVGAHGHDPPAHLISDADGRSVIDAADTIRRPTFNTVSTNAVAA